MARSLVIAALVFLALPANGAEPVSAPIRLVRELLSQPESELNIGDAALRLSSLVDADADPAEGRARLDGRRGTATPARPEGDEVRILGPSSGPLKRR